MKARKVKQLSRWSRYRMLPMTCGRFYSIAIYRNGRLSHRSMVSGFDGKWIRITNNTVNAVMAYKALKHLQEMDESARTIMAPSSDATQSTQSELLTDC